MATEESVLTEPDEGAAGSRLRFSEIGIQALKTRNGVMYEEATQAFRYPQMLRVVAEMEVSPPVAIGLNGIKMLMNRTSLKVVPVEGETAQDAQRRRYLETIQDDMDFSWQSTLQAISSYLQYGHQVSEIVLRRRLPKNGSKHSDGLIGLQGLLDRPQNSIKKWNFSDDGRELEGISQSLANLENSSRFAKLTNTEGYIEIPRAKFLLFRADPKNGNPEGTSILRSVYLAYKRAEQVTNELMLGVSKYTKGIPLAYLPVKYMAEDAVPSDKAVYESVQRIVKGIADGTEPAVVFPMQVDQDTKQNIFKLEMLESKGGQPFDMVAIIKMFKAEILSVLSSDAVVQGDKAGSLSLQDGNTSLLALQVAYRLSEIASVLNEQLVPTLWRANKWDLSRMPKYVFADVSSVSLEEFSKYLQRVLAVGAMEMDRGVMNKVREVGGFDLLPEDEPINKDILSTTLMGKASSSGQGMAVGVVGDGTSTSAPSEDNSAKNADNKA
jgi:hypothetical protein